MRQVVRNRHFPTGSILGGSCNSIFCTFQHSETLRLSLSSTVIQPKAEEQHKQQNLKDFTELETGILSKPRVSVLWQTLHSRSLQSTIPGILHQSDSVVGGFSWISVFPSPFLHCKVGITQVHSPRIRHFLPSHADLPHSRCFPPPQEQHRDLGELFPRGGWAGGAEEQP